MPCPRAPGQGPKACPRALGPASGPRGRITAEHAVFAASRVTLVINHFYPWMMVENVSMELMMVEKISMGLVMAKSMLLKMTL